MNIMTTPYIYVTWLCEKNTEHRHNLTKRQINCDSQNSSKASNPLWVRLLNEIIQVSFTGQKQTTHTLDEVTCSAANNFVAFQQTPTKQLRYSWTRKPCCRRETARCRCKFWSISTASWAKAEWMRNWKYHLTFSGAGTAHNLYC